MQFQVYSKCLCVCVYMFEYVYNLGKRSISFGFIFITFIWRLQLADAASKQMREQTLQSHLNGNVNNEEENMYTAHLCESHNFFTPFSPFFDLSLMMPVYARDSFCVTNTIKREICLLMFHAFWNLFFSIYLQRKSERIKVNMMRGKNNNNKSRRMLKCQRENAAHKQNTQNVCII